MNISTFISQIERLPAAYRSAPFWSWNDRLERQELERQIDDFQAHGIGGFIIHAREGLETPYMSAQWKEFVRLCAERGTSHGMIPYIYDDERWPSGMAGGQITAENAEFRASAIVLTNEAGGKNTFAARIEGNKILSLRWNEAPRPEETRIVIDEQQSAGSDWYNGFSPADNLNPQSVRAFLNMTHEQYKDVFGGDLSGKIKGFFTDEPNFSDFFADFQKGHPWLPWTKQFSAYFQEKRGYTIVPYLPYLFYQGEYSLKIRHDYWRTLTELFSEAYFKQIYDWCEKNGVQSVGHLLFENSLCSQTRVCGAAMPQYRYLHVPGIDILGEQTEEYLTVKQCTSVAHQFNRRAISETYGCTGWELSLEGQKRLWDWQAVMGINLRCMHLAQYSIKGLRKRDYPPSINYQTPWWQENKQLEDYCARMSVCADSGEVCRPILVLHPQSTVWMYCGSDPNEDLRHFDPNMGWTDRNIVDLNAEYDRINLLAQALVKNQCDFDFADEILLQAHGKVKNGQIVMGAARYQVVVVPEVETIFDSTRKLLSEFAMSGGRVIWLRRLPERIEADQTDAIRQTFHAPEIAHDESTLLEKLTPYRTVRIDDLHTMRAAPVLTSLRQVEDGWILITVNSDRQKNYRCVITLPVSGYVEELDLLTGKRKPIAHNKKMTFYTDYQSSDAKVFLIRKDIQPVFTDVHPIYHDVHESPAAIACFGPVAHFTRTEPNTLTLDRCRWKIEADWSREQSVWEAQKEIRIALGFRPVEQNGLPMRYRWLPGSMGTRTVFLRFAFFVNTEKPVPLQLALEESENTEIFCNDVRCKRKTGWFVDRAIHTFSLENVKKGENELCLKLDYAEQTELEEIYLLGDFAVNRLGQIVEEPDMLRFGDWCLQGYPFYNGSMIYHFRFSGEKKTAKLVLGRYSASCVTVQLNGGEKIHIPWRAADGRSVELQDGENRLDIEVFSSNRNLLGPLHQAYKLCSRIDWRDFRTEGSAFYSREPVLYPYGLMDQCYLLRLEEDKEL